MADEKTKNDTEVKEKDVKDAPTNASEENKTEEPKKPRPKKKISFINTGGKGKGRRGFGGSRKPKSEYDQRIIGIRRVTRVMAGGRRFSFSVAIVSGNRKGKVGVGVGKAGDTALAIEKAGKHAKKCMIEVPRTKEGSIAHAVEAKYCSAKIFIKPSPGRGLSAGSAVRTILELAGIKDVSAKVISRSKNKINNARATIKALSDLNK